MNICHSWYDFVTCTIHFSISIGKKNRVRPMQQQRRHRTELNTWLEQNSGKTKNFIVSFFEKLDQRFWSRDRTSPKFSRVVDHELGLFLGPSKPKTRIWASFGPGYWPYRALIEVRRLTTLCYKVFLCGDVKFGLRPPAYPRLLGQFRAKFWIDCNVK